MGTEFEYLFSPLRIGPIEVRNRMMTSAHATRLGDSRVAFGEPGFYGERYARYLADRAKGGVGLITFGQVAVHPTTAYEHENCSIGWDEGCIPGMKLAADMIHEHGAKVFVQLFHSGVNNDGGSSRLPVWGPSGIAGPPSKIFGETAHAMDRRDIAELVEYYRRCARNVRAAGMDGIEIHATHSYLLHQFLSPLYNHRTDEYGGSLENRMRLVLEVVDGIREELGDGLALGLRIPADDLMPGGLVLEDMQEVSRRLDATGRVDFLNVSLGTVHNFAALIPNLYFPHAAYVHLAAAIKEVTQRARICCFGRIVDPREAEQILADGQADMVVMNRAFIADPELANKAREGRLDEIRNCAGDCQGCFGATRGPMGCVTNPAVGREQEWGIGTLLQAPVRKKVMVVGGGPGGMEAAWVAASRGHDVTLFEKSSELGGQNNLAYRLPGRGEMESFTRWRRTMIEKHGVRVKTNTPVDVAAVEAERPDVVVIATGSTPRKDAMNGFTLRTVAGWEQSNVIAGDNVVNGTAKVGESVVIYDVDAFVRAPAIAEMLADQGKRVRLITPAMTIGGRMEWTNVETITRRLAQRENLEILLQTVVLGIEGTVVSAFDAQRGRPVAFEDVDTLVVCGFGLANDGLYYELEGKVRELHLIGDALAPRTIDRALFDGHRVGRTI